MASEHGTCVGALCIMSGNIQPRVIKSHGQYKKDPNATFRMLGYGLALKSDVPGRGITYYP